MSVIDGARLSMRSVGSSSCVFEIFWLQQHFVVCPLCLSSLAPLTCDAGWPAPDCEACARSDPSCAGSSLPCGHHCGS